MGRRLRSRAPDSGHYGVASDGGAENWAVIASLIETCKLNGVDPHAYLTDVITEKSSQAKDVRIAVGSRYGDVLAAEGHLLDLLEPEDVVPAWKRWSPILLRPEGLYGTRPAEGGNKARSDGVGVLDLSHLIMRLRAYLRIGHELGPKTLVIGNRLANRARNPVRSLFSGNRDIFQQKQGDYCWKTGNCYEALGT